MSKGMYVHMHFRGNPRGYLFHCCPEIYCCLPLFPKIKMLIFFVPQNCICSPVPFILNLARLGTHKTGLPPPPPVFYTDRSHAVLLLLFLTVTCSCCPYLYFGSAIMLVTYFVNFRLLNDHLFGKELFIRLPRVPFVNCRQFMYLVISLLVLRVGCGI